jgi:hypothetical protein
MHAERDARHFRMFPPDASLQSHVRPVAMQCAPVTLGIRLEQGHVPLRSAPRKVAWGVRGRQERARPKVRRGPLHDPSRARAGSVSGPDAGACWSCAVRLCPRHRFHPTTAAACGCGSTAGVHEHSRAWLLDADSVCCAAPTCTARAAAPNGHAAGTWRHENAKGIMHANTHTLSFRIMATAFQAFQAIREQII